MADHGAAPMKKTNTWVESSEEELDPTREMNPRRYDRTYHTLQQKCRAEKLVRLTKDSRKAGQDGIDVNDSC